GRLIGPGVVGRVDDEERRANPVGDRAGVLINRLQSQGLFVEPSRAVQIAHSQRRGNGLVLQHLGLLFGSLNAIRPCQAYPSALRPNQLRPERATGGDVDREAIRRSGSVNGKIVDEFMATGATVAGRGTFEPAGGWGGDTHDGVPLFSLSRHEPPAD